MDVTVDFLNSYPFFTGDLVLGKTVTKADSSDPDATEPYKVTVTLSPASEAREVDRTITWTDADGASRSFTVPALKNDGTDETEFELTVLVPVDDTVTLDGVPTGEFTATETVKGTVGYIYDFYKVKYNKALHNNEYPTTGNSEKVIGVIHGGHPTTVTFNNTYKKGDLTIVKTVTQEYPNDNWTEDTFTFTVDGTTELPDGTYHNIIVNGDESKPRTVTVTDGELTLSGTISVTKTAGDAFWTESLTIENLPAGYYTVTETLSDTQKNQYTVVGSGEKKLVNVTDNGGTEFAIKNTYNRTTGSLQVSKIIEIVGEGHSIDTEQEFEFTVELTDGTLVGPYSISDSSEELSVVGGKLTFNLKHGESIQIDGLPVGKYLVKEKNVDSYKSGFTIVVDENYNGEYVTISNADVSGGKSVLDCENQYPVNLATLVVRKIVEDSPDNSDLDSAPESDIFKFTVDISDYSILATLDKIVQATIHNADGTVPQNSAYELNGEKLTFQLLAGQYATIQLPACNYIVTETALSSEVNTDVLSDHYDTTYVLNDTEPANGTIANGTLESNGIATVVFTNTYKRHYADLKIIQSGMTSETDSGIYELVYKTKDDEEPVLVTVMITGNSYVIVEQVPVDEYTLREIESDWTWTYESTGDGTGYENPTVKVVVTAENRITFTHTGKHIDWLHHENAYMMPVSAAISLVNDDDENDGEGDDA